MWGWFIIYGKNRDEMVSFDPIKAWNLQSNRHSPSKFEKTCEQTYSWLLKNDSRLCGRACAGSKRIKSWSISGYRGVVGSDDVKCSGNKTVRTLLSLKCCSGDSIKLWIGVHCDKWLKCSCWIGKLPPCWVWVSSCLFTNYNPKSRLTFNSFRTNCCL